MASSKRKKKNLGRKAPTTVELNVMPFVDVFSLLTTFLLFSAVFLAIGILEVQIPFLSNTPPPPDKPARELEVKVDLERTKITLTTSYTAPPENEKNEVFQRDPDGISQMHQKLVGIRLQNPKLDKLSFFVEDDVTYAQMTEVLDAIKLRQPGDPEIPIPPDANEKQAAVLKSALFPKVVMQSVMLQ